MRSFDLHSSRESSAWSVPFIQKRYASQRAYPTASLAITGGPNSDKDGVPGNQEDRRVQHVIPQAAVDAGKYEVIIEVSCNGMFGLGMNGYRHQRPDVRS